MIGDGVSPVINNDGIISYPAPDCSADPRGLGCVIYDKMVENKDMIAQTDGITGEADTFQSLLQKCIRTAIVMRSKEVSAEDIITICSSNHLNSCVPYIAALFLGAKVACLDPTLCLPDTVTLVKLVRPKIIFVSAEAIELIENALRQSEVNAEIVVFGESTIYPQFSEFLTPSQEEINFLPVPAADINDTVIIVFTGGTTGVPKGVCLSHKSLLTQSYDFSIYRSQDGVPIQHMHSIVIFSTFYWLSSVTLLLISIFIKRRRVVVPAFDVCDFWELIERAKVNVAFLVPSQAQLICKRGKPSGVDVSNLMQIMLTGGPASIQLIEDLRLLVPGVDIRNVYAMTEAGGHVTSFRPHAFPDDKFLIRRKPTSCGRPRPGISCKVVDNETGEILGPHHRGELRIKTDYVMDGYYRNNSSVCWDSDGWLKTGDVGYYDEDNCFYIVERVNDVLRFRTSYVYPEKIEAILYSHPAVEMVVVVGIPHPEDGDHPIGVVVLRRLAVGTITAEDLVHYVDERIDDEHRLRGGVRIVQSIPMTPTGKPKKRDVRRLLLGGEI